MSILKSVLISIALHLITVFFGGTICYLIYDPYVLEAVPNLPNLTYFQALVLVAFIRALYTTSTI